MKSARIPALLAILAIAAVARAQTPSPQAPAPPPSSPGANHSVELDHVVAMIGSNVILQSDVEQEMHLSALEPLQVLPGRNTPDAALRRLIDRTLILEQMKQQQQTTTTAAPQVAKSLAELKKQIPACTDQYHCQTPEGWARFLKANDITQQEVDKRWSQRLAMLDFIDMRFRSGIRISQDQIAAYYQKTLVPALEKDNQKAPPLHDVSSRIREVLLEQQVSGLFQDWLSSLRDQGNVQIVDPAYNADLESTPVTAEQ